MQIVKSEVLVQLAEILRDLRALQCRNLYRFKTFPKSIELGTDVKLVLFDTLDFCFGFDESLIRLTCNFLLRLDAAIDLPQGGVAFVDLVQRPVNISDAIQQGSDVDFLPLNIA